MQMPGITGTDSASTEPDSGVEKARDMQAMCITAKGSPRSERICITAVRGRWRRRAHNPLR
jgi:hypothetical protein